MRETFREELMGTGYIHSPLPLHRERSLEAHQAAKEVLERKSIWDGADPARGVQPVLRGIGDMRIAKNAEKNDKYVIEIAAPTARDTLPYDDGATAAQFRSVLAFPLPGEDWEGYHRAVIWVKPDSMGSHSVHLRVHIRNEGRSPVPDAYGREGQHLANLVNHEWNQVIWEFASLPRDLVTELAVSMDADGRDTATGDVFRFRFGSFEVQKVNCVGKERGWECEAGHVAYSMSGYHRHGKKTAVAGGDAEDFSLLDERGETVLRGTALRQEGARGTFSVLDFSAVEEEGYYRLKSGDIVTPPFEIGEKVMESAVWKALNFIFCERCGYPVPGKHGRCHTDVLARHRGVAKSFGGGWHDAGDMSQQMLQTAEVAQELLELAGRVEDDPLLRHRLLEEGLWGLEFTLNSRFGDGYRASSAGLGLWTDNLIGNVDDVEARVHNQAFQNFFCGAVEAQAALALGEVDPELAWKCVQAAKEDFWFAKRRFEEKGLERPVMWEHTLNSGPSQYYAAAAWAAASICMNDAAQEELAQEARRFGRMLLACQETGTKGVPMRGFFYRDESRRTIVHFAHQGRDHSFVQALDALCRAFPQCPDRKDWERGMELYGEYLKGLYEMAMPYGMLPAGLYSLAEAEDSETFGLLHLLADHETEKPNYEAQVRAGIPLGDGYYVRMFPVWFSFRGNAAIMLSMGKAAAIVGKRLGDEKLLEIAREQLYWMSGKNPFCQSLIYGEGERYCQQDANYPGEMTGEMPVGIQTRGNEDEPYWPAGNNATYKEVWLTTAGRWLSIIAELYPAI